MLKNNKGDIITQIAIGTAIVGVLFSIVLYMIYSDINNKRVEISKEADKYIRLIEKDGYLTDSNRIKLEEYLYNSDVEAIVDGTLYKVKPGDKVFLLIRVNKIYGYTDNYTIYKEGKADTR